MQVCLHKVGNRAEDEGLRLSKQPVIVSEDLENLLMSYFITPFKSELYYHFIHESSLDLNEVYAYATAIFNNPEDLQTQSVHLAKHLYAKSTHAKIKGGEFYVVYFKDFSFQGESLDAIGLFKSENKDTFLKIFPKEQGFEIESEEGININKLDKGCIIYHTKKEDGYLVSIVDNTNKGTEAQYWMDDFLHVRQVHDQYFNTEKTLQLCKNYIVQKLPEEYEVSKADQADLLNRSMNFFKEKENFDFSEFNQDVFQQSELIISFNKYKDQYQEEQEVEISDSFAISDAAVKKQGRYYKSVIKLDKNFHIYVHGNKELIEQGEDDHGRFYKLYFKEEH